MLYLLILSKSVVVPNRRDKKKTNRKIVVKPVLAVETNNCYDNLCTQSYTAFLDSRLHQLTRCPTVVSLCYSNTKRISAISRMKNSKKYDQIYYVKAEILSDEI